MLNDTREWNIETQLSAPDEMQLNSSAVHISNLQAAVRNFCQRTELSYGSERARQNGAIAALHNLMLSIEEADAGGIDRAITKAILAEAVAIQNGSPFFHRVCSWPRGYAGDFETVEYICDSINRAPSGTFAHACEQYFLSSAPACQHRNKIEHQARLLVATSSRLENARILVLGCGGGRDLLLARDSLRRGKSTVVVNDIDQAALALCASRLDCLGERLVPIRGNALEQMRTFEEKGPFDLILCGGLMDYIPGGLMKRSLRTLYKRLLAPAGTLFITNIATGNPHRPWMECCANWTLIERSEEDIRSFLVAAGAPEDNVAISRDATGLALLAEVHK